MKPRIASRLIGHGHRPAADPARWRGEGPLQRTGRVAGLRHLAAGVVEAGWLLVAVAAALLFQVNAIRSFEFAKATLLLVLTPWLLAAAGVALVLGGGMGDAAPRAARPGPRRLPLAVAGAVGLSYLLSTALSVSPSISLWGSRFNSEGLATTLGYLALFSLVAAFMRRPDQVERLVDVVLLASVPAALYGLVQYLGLDPLRAAMSVQLAGGQIVSTLGNPILAGGYAAMVLPLTAARLLGALRALRRDDRAPAGEPLLRPALALLAAVALQIDTLLVYLLLAARSPRLWWAAPVPLLVFLLWAVVVRRRWPGGRAGAALAVGAYALLLGLQLLLLVLARSRGPFVALPIALAAVLFLLVDARRVRLGLGALGAAASLVVLLVVGLPALARADPAVAELPGVSALARLGGPANTVSSRWLIWSGVVDLALRGHEPVVVADPVARLRPLVGYGPETLAMVYERVATAEARRAEPFRISRAHNAPLDALASRGLLGLAVWAFALAALAQAARRARRCGGALGVPAAGAAGALVAYAVAQLFEPSDAGLSLHFWLFAGLLVSPAVQIAGAAADPAPVASPAPAGRSGDGAARRGRERHPAHARPGGPPAAPAPVPRAGRRWTVGGLVVVTGALLGVAAGWTSDFAAFGPLLIAWLVLALAGLAWAFLPVDPPAARGGSPVRGLLLGVPLVVAASYLSSTAFARLEADAYSKYGLEAARQGDFPAAFALSRDAVMRAPDSELYYSNLARALTAAATGAAEPTTRAELRPSLELLHGLEAREVTALGRREVLLLAEAALRRAVVLAPLEPDNRFNLAIVDRALADLGEPGRRELAREQLRLLTVLGPTHDAYRQELAALEATGR